MEHNRPLVIYHGQCPDGFTAAWCAWRALEDTADYLPASYDDSPPDVSGRPTVHILDFSYPHEILQAMAKKARWVLVLDHHESRCADLGGHLYELGGEEKEQFYGHGNLTCHYHPAKSGARLAWESFHHPEPAPFLIDLVEDRDLWRWKILGSREINAWLATQPRDFETWDTLAGCMKPAFVQEDWFYTGTSGKAYSHGETILRYQAGQIDFLCSLAREIEIGEHKVLAANAPVLQSEVAGKLAEGRPFGAVWYLTAEGRRRWSVRSTPEGIDVGKLAKEHGGGGHVHAAGWTEK